VSRATVSYVLNHNPHQTIAPTTRQRVLDAAARLSYTPSVAAQMLRGVRSRVVLCLLSDWPLGYSTMEMLEGLSQILREHELTLVLHTHDPAALEADVWRSVTAAAVISFNDVSPATATAIRAAGIDVLVPMFGRRATLGRTLEAAQHRIAQLQVEHLRMRGHRRLAYAAADDPRFRRLSAARFRGIQAACQRAGLPAPATLTVPLELAGAVEALRALRLGPRGTTAALCATDDVALAVLGAMHRLGRAVPKDLAVMGTEDIPAAQLAVPALTTVRVDTSWVARRMGEVIVAALRGEAVPPARGVAPTTLVQRDSA